MRIVQWNTHHGGKRSDGVLDTAGFGRALAKLHPDVVCLNEVEQFDGYGNDDKVQQWASALGPDWQGWFATLSGVSHGHGQGNAILARSIDVVSSVVIKTLYDSRVALAITVKDVLIVSTHLDDAKQPSRIVEMVQVLGWQPVQSAAKIAICGDWNALPEAIEMAPLRILYRDAWTTAASHTSFNGTGATKSHRIDAIFTKGLTVASCDVPDTSVGGIFPSDHAPVVAVTT